MRAVYQFNPSLPLRQQNQLLLYTTAASMLTRPYPREDQARWRYQPTNTRKKEGLPRRQTWQRIDTNAPHGSHLTPTHSPLPHRAGVHLVVAGLISRSALWMSYIPPAECSSPRSFGRGSLCERRTPDTKECKTSRYK